MTFVVKAALTARAGAAQLSFDEKTMYHGKTIGAGDEIFVFASDHQGGRGLCAKGVVISAAPGPGIRRRVKVRIDATAKRPLGRNELKPFRERTNDRPQTEIARKLYRQATNKIARISDKAAKFLRTHF